MYGRILISHSRYLQIVDWFFTPSWSHSVIQIEAFDIFRVMQPKALAMCSRNTTYLREASRNVSRMDKILSNTFKSDIYSRNVVVTRDDWWETDMENEHNVSWLKVWASSYVGAIENRRILRFPASYTQLFLFCPSVSCRKTFDEFIYPSDWRRLWTVEDSD